MDLLLLNFILKNDFGQLTSELPSFYKTLVSEVGGILPQESLKRIQTDFEKGQPIEAAEEIQRALQSAENATLNVAVIGQSGSGKSSFINVLRGIGHEQAGSASVGVVPTTTKKTPYPHPKCPNMTFWDLPGTGTPESNPDPYQEVVGDDNYDFFIIISSSRFSANDAFLAQKIQEKGKKFYFVRTKVDSDLYNERKSKPRSFKNETVLQQIRDNCLVNLSKIVSEPTVFLVSNFKPKKFDFPKLQETLLQDLPAEKRYIALLLCPNLSESFIEMKRAMIKEKVWLKAVRAAILAFIPLTPFFCGFNLSEQKQQLKHYQSDFGLDEESVSQIAQNLGISEQEIYSLMKSADFNSLVKDDSIIANVKKCAEFICSVTGLPQSSIFQFYKVYFLHLKFIDTVAEDAKRVWVRLRR
ncbi:T-cell-specific guanine nucleotide triphosphate-binding protein 2-like [Budorcas taxicolor]|uniref:T-cell-specific guanine nucleotide triphosphate-binding protein 2-like n=1 Tax=Budorcas taxicolor TaxID=37181 RepID=UPI002284EC73|nr:T-cell-specific guanine nucleotide triphosphate-binding protein 2-like [Budorcas taxicolor]XP_052499240.1 T-cell-specific guanine nucleotide triphosphate-binding protein 2-like [Budorcas taxicolor]